MSRFARLLVVAVTAAAFAAVPALAQAAGGHGNRCGKAHAKQTRAVGKACAKNKSRARQRGKAAPTTVVPAAAVKKCREEQAADEVAFHVKYANAAGREAFGRCVRLNVENRGDSADDSPELDFASAAQACAAEKAADPQAFVSKYGDEDGHEAFGHCVRENAAPIVDGSQAEQGDDSSSGDDGEQVDQPDEGDGSGADAGGGDSGAVEAIPGLDSLFF